MALQGPGSSFAHQGSACFFVSPWFWWVVLDRLRAWDCVGLSGDVQMGTEWQFSCLHRKNTVRAYRKMTKLCSMDEGTVKVQKSV